MTNSVHRTATVRTSPQHDPTVQSQQAGQIDNQPSHGHTFGDVVLRDRASAHIGDSYTSYHIYNTSDRESSTTRSSLTIGDAMTGILAASARAIVIVSVLSNPPSTLRTIKEEITSLRIILSSLQKFVDSVSSAKSERASLIELEDVITVMTQLVLLYSEIEALIDDEGREKRRQWNLLPRKELTAARLLNKLQRHRSTLSIILQILQCRSNLEARNQASLLSMRTDYELRSSPAMAERLLHLEPVEDAAVDSASTYRTPLNTVLGTNSARVTDNDIPQSDGDTINPNVASLQCDATEGSTTGDLPFGTIVAQSRVYRRVEHREIDVGSMNCSTRSRGWSILSGISASKVTSVSVICLPLDDNDLIRFRRYLPAPTLIDPFRSTGYPLPVSEPINNSQKSPESMHLRDLKWCSTYGVNTYVRSSPLVNLLNHDCSKRLMEEWVGHTPHDPTGICASPISDDLTFWRAEIRGPIDTPFERGTFLLRIKYPPLYPSEPPRYTFITKIYHPNIDEEGNISLDVLGSNWNPLLTAPKMLLSISSLLDDPNVDEPLVPQIAHIYKNNRAAYDATAREWTRLYATDSQAARGKMTSNEPSQVEEPQPADMHGSPTVRKCHRVVEIESMAPDIVAYELAMPVEACSAMIQDDEGLKRLSIPVKPQLPALNPQDDARTRKCHRAVEISCVHCQWVDIGDR